MTREGSGSAIGAKQIAPEPDRDGTSLECAGLICHIMRHTDAGGELFERLFNEIA